MKELVKVNNAFFREYYEGLNEDKRVVCVLDDYCVRYIVFENGKQKSRREFSNEKKELCMKNAKRALNK